MKNLIILLILATGVTLSSCSVSADKDAEVLSSWKLIEEKISPGGEAEFVPATRDEVITFLSNSQVRNSSSWCHGAGETIADYNAADGKIFVNCNGTGNSINFEIKDDIMILWNPMCIEACEYKFERIQEDE